MPRNLCRFMSPLAYKMVHLLASLKSAKIYVSKESKNGREEAES